MNKKLLALTISATFGLSGCINTQENIREYQNVSMVKADILPTKAILSGVKQKIVIFPADSSDVPMAKASHVGNTIAMSLETQLADVGVEVVDRSIASKLKKELALAESKGKSSYNGPEIANYAITGHVSNAGLSYDFTKRRSYVDDDGKRHVTPAHCRFTATVSANLKLYKLPGLAYSKTILTDDSASFSTDTSNSRCPISDAASASLLRKAANAGVESNREAFQNFFAPKAYVLERKVNGDKSLFKISAGKNFGFKAESTITFYNLEVNKNPLTGDVAVEEYSVVEGTVAANLISDNYAWILVDSELADNVKLGDYVKVKYEKSIWKKWAKKVDDGIKGLM